MYVKQYINFQQHKITDLMNELIVERVRFIFLSLNNYYLNIDNNIGEWKE